MQEPFLEGVPQDISRLTNKMYTQVIIIKSIGLKRSAAELC